MKAVIPAAGEGKRFNKDSTYMHKCLVPINGKALLLYTLENLTNIKEITECIVIIGENHEKIIDTIGTKVNDTPILFCKQKQSVEKYYDVFYKKGILLQKNSNLYVLVQSVIYLVGFSLVIYFAGTDLANGRITVGQFTIIFTYMGIALSNTNLILTFGQTYQNTKTSYNRIKELYQLELREDGLLKKETVNFIEAKDISYIFENGNGLNKISADFQKGKRYLICGSNGAGKTTFINILIRQYKSLSGDIFIDNINIKKINYEQLRLNCFSVMNQEQKFPSVSVVEYINLSNNTEYSTREIIDRLIMKDMYNIAMDIHEVLEKETQNINMLSGGEKQKVELVKTILKDADVYFFDEPTAHLDQESRDEYYQYLKKQKDKIIVVVSHNSQERQYFDVIYEV